MRIFNNLTDDTVEFYGHTLVGGDYAYDDAYLLSTLKSRIDNLEKRIQ
jgi:hypothetical protein